MHAASQVTTGPSTITSKAATTAVLTIVRKRLRLRPSCTLRTHRLRIERRVCAIFFTSVRFFPLLYSGKTAGTRFWRTTSCVLDLSGAATAGGASTAGATSLVSSTTNAAPFKEAGDTASTGGIFTAGHSPVSASSSTVSSANNALPRSEVTASSAIDAAGVSTTSSSAAASASSEEVSDGSSPGASSFEDFSDTFSPGVASASSEEVDGSV